jgi:L-alanine-DL-glutamate epimerase-like enolase superfamily enzyme
MDEFHWSHGVQLGANIVIVSIQSDDGLIGRGEAVSEDPVAFVPHCESIAQGIVGRSPTEIGAILDAVSQDPRGLEAPRLTRAALDGIEVACWDLLGRALGVPSRAFFGGAVRDEIDFFAFVLGDDPATLAAHARSLSGYQAYYMKVGETPDYAERVAAVREAIGPDALLRIDSNEAWDVETAIERIQHLEPYNLDWVEQPISRSDVAGLAHVRRSVETKIAADESVETIPQLRDVLEREAADVVVQDTHAAGGLLQLRQQAALCEAWDVMLNIHAPMQSEISFLAHAQLASTIPNLTLGNQVMHHLLAEPLTLPAHEPVQGRYSLNETSGHGFEIDLEAVAQANERWQRDGPYTVAPGS